MCVSQIIILYPLNLHRAVVNYISIKLRGKNKIEMPAFSPTHLSSGALKNCFHLPLESSSALFFLHITSWNFLALTMHLQNFWLLANFYIIKSKLLNIEIKIPQIWPLPLFSHACTLSLT